MTFGLRIFAEVIRIEIIAYVKEEFKFAWVVCRTYGGSSLQDVEILFLSANKRRVNG